MPRNIEAGHKIRTIGCPGIYSGVERLGLYELLLRGEKLIYLLG
jgi:hypothetical protein